MERYEELKMQVVELDWRDIITDSQTETEPISGSGNG